MPASARFVADQGGHSRRERLIRTGILTVLLCLAGFAPPPTADAGTNQEERPYVQATPGYAYRFPRDHGSHDAYRTEWWYYTGHLTAADGRRFGYQLTFFRRAVEPKKGPAATSRWAIHQLYFAHLALSDLTEGRFRYADKISRAGLGKAGAEAERLHVWIDRWSLDADPRTDAHRLRAAAQDFSIDLTAQAEKPPAIHGRDGVSRKGAGPGQASHYFSSTRMRTTGTVTIAGQPLTVEGLSWMDHEFGSSELDRDLAGWDWFSVQLADGSECMLYLLRHADGGIDPASSGSLIRADGRVQPLVLADFSVAVKDWWTSPHSGARYPSRWTLMLPSLGLVLDATPELADQELRTARSTRVIYWEGAVRIAGTRHGIPLDGHGYVELVGYAPRSKPRL